MSATEPGWWYARQPGWPATLLRPLAYLYGGISVARFAITTPRHVDCPVICVGNFTAGGTGKTPVSITVSDVLKDMGYAPWFLSRGYGGSLKGPVRVDPVRHTAAQTGDEPLLLAEHCPTVIARNRIAGGKAILAAAPTNAVIIMDDGLQNPVLHKDLRVAVVDAQRGLGNGHVIPAGPLRQPLRHQIKNTDLIILNRGTTNAQHLSDAVSLATFDNLPRLSVVTEPTDVPSDISGRRVIAFAGIANPARFFDVLRGCGADVVGCHAFADHQPFTEADAARLLAEADVSKADLFTTAKDWVRMSAVQGKVAALKQRSNVLSIRARFADGDAATLRQYLTQAIAAAQARRAQQRS